MASAPCTAWEWGTRPRPHARPQWWTCAWQSSCASPGLCPRFGCGWSCIAFPSCWGWAGSAWCPAPLRPSRRGGQSTSGRRRPALGFRPTRKNTQLDELGRRRQRLAQKRVASRQLMFKIPKRAGKASNLSVCGFRTPGWVQARGNVHLVVKAPRYRQAGMTKHSPHRWSAVRKKLTLRVSSAQTSLVP